MARSVKGRHPGSQGAVRSTENRLQTTRWRHTHTMEGWKVCHMGRHSDGYDGTVLPPCDILPETIVIALRLRR